MTGRRFRPRWPIGGSLVLLLVGCGSSPGNRSPADAPPTITAVVGNAPGSPSVLQDGLLVTGTGLGSAAFSLRAGGTATSLVARSRQDTSAEVLVPAALRAGSYDLVAANGAGSASIAVALTLPTYTGDELVSTVNTATSRLAMSVMPSEVGNRLATLEDAGLLRRTSCRAVTLDNPAAGDLADQLAPLLTRNGCVDVVLAPGTTWFWDKRLDVREGQILTVTGAGFANVATNITVQILMTQNLTSTRCDGTTPLERNPGRLVVAGYGEFALAGVKVTAAIDPGGLVLGGAAEYGGSLFNCMGQSSSLTLEQIRITTSEDVAGVGSRGFCNVRFGHTFIDRATGVTRPIQAAKIFTGCSFAGGFGFVHASHTSLGTVSGAGTVELNATPQVLVAR